MRLKTFLVRALLMAALGFTALYTSEQRMYAIQPVSCCGQDSSCDVVNRNTRCSNDSNCTSIGYNFPSCCSQACAA